MAPHGHSCRVELGEGLTTLDVPSVGYELGTLPVGDATGR